MKIVLNRKGYFDLSPMALEKLAYLESEGSLNKYYYEGIIENNDYYVLIKKVDDDIDDIFKIGSVFDVGIILTNEIFDEEVTKLHVNDFKKLDKLKIISAEYSEEYKRTDKNLIAVVEELVEKSSTYLSSLEVVEIPDGLSWEIINTVGGELLMYGEKEAMDKINIL